MRGSNNVVLIIFIGVRGELFDNHRDGLCPLLIIQIIFFLLVEDGNPRLDYIVYLLIQVSSFVITCYVASFREPGNLTKVASYVVSLSLTVGLMDMTPTPLIT
jgi:hypothetical protein